MKKYILLFLTIFIFSSCEDIEDPNSPIPSWVVPDPPEEPEEDINPIQGRKDITFNVLVNETKTFEINMRGKFEIDWGDGNIEIINLKQDNNVSHTYKNVKKTYAIRISGEGLYGFNIDKKMKISKLKFINCPRLKNLSIEAIDITDINLNVFPKLETIRLVNTKLTNLEISNKNILKKVDLYWNRSLKSLKIYNNEYLRHIECNQSNILSNLYIANNINLRYFTCEANGINSLDVSENKKLETLRCKNNKLKSIKTDAPRLSEFVCNNNELGEEALESIFNDLYMIKHQGPRISIGENKGTKACDKSVANKKGWSVENDPIS